MDEEMIRRLLNREYPDNGRVSNGQANSFSERGLPQQSHVHEYIGSTFFADSNGIRHNHRFSGVTTEVIPIPDGEHRHVIYGNTDSVGHHHEVSVETGPPIPVGNGKHIHFAEGNTTLDNFHVHGFEFVTQIENPTVPNTPEPEPCNCNCTCTCNCNCRCCQRNRG